MCLHAYTCAQPLDHAPILQRCCPLPCTPLLVLVPVVRNAGGALRAGRCGCAQGRTDRLVQVSGTARYLQARDAVFECTVRRAATTGGVPANCAIQPALPYASMPCLYIHLTVSETAQLPVQFAAGRWPEQATQCITKNLLLTHGLNRPQYKTHAHSTKHMHEQATVQNTCCAQEWARNQVDACVLRLMNESEEEQAAPLTAAQARVAAEWGCPKCRQQYPASDLPRTYTCFCGKVEDPEWCVRPS